MRIDFERFSRRKVLRSIVAGVGAVVVASIPDNKKPQTKKEIIPQESIIFDPRMFLWLTDDVSVPPTQEMINFLHHQPTVNASRELEKLRAHMLSSTRIMN